MKRSLAVLAAVVAVAVVSAGCSGGGGGPSDPVHPVLDQDYSGVFAGSWQGTFSLSADGQYDSYDGYAEFRATDFNRLAVVALCDDKDGLIGLDSPSTFSLHPITCAPVQASCGPVTVEYSDGTGGLQGDVLSLTFNGTMRGCGQSLRFTQTFSGTRPGTDSGYPVMVLPSPVAASVGVPVTLDASGTYDPDGRSLTYVWTVLSGPPGSAPTLTGETTPQASFTADVAGAYTVQLMVTASDGQSTTGWVTVNVAAGGGPGDHGGPQVVLASTTVATDLGVPVTVDASASTDPDGRALQFSWTLVSAPPGPQPSLTGANTARATLTGQIAGSYLLRVQVTASDGQSAAAALTVVVRPPPANGKVIVSLQSDPGDWVGLGSTYQYTLADAVIAVSAYGNSLHVTVTGDEWWSGDFALPSSVSRLTPGVYPNVTRYAFSDPAVGGLDWSGEGRGCNTILGTITVDGATYAGDTLTSVDLRFEQHCEGGAAALHGEVHWASTDVAQIPGPVNPPPAGLWTPAPGSTPATGNFMFLQSEPGDYVGAGQTLLYQGRLVQASASGGHLAVSVDPYFDSWFGDFQAMTTLTRLAPGYYGNLGRYPFHNPARGGLDWFGEGRGCNTLTGWFVVDGVTYGPGDALQAIDLRFEQHCEGMAPALHGQLHWTSAGATLRAPADRPAVRRGPVESLASRLPPFVSRAVGGAPRSE